MPRENGWDGRRRLWTLLRYLGFGPRAPRGEPLQSSWGLESEPSIAAPQGVPKLGKGIFGTS